MSQTTTTTSSGMGVSGLLTILFVALKLLDKIDWSWWWVLSPIWLPWAVFLAILIVIAIIALFCVIAGALLR